MFMGHLGVPTKKIVKGNECFIFYFCILCSADYANYFDYVPCGSLGVLHAIIASHAFAEKHFKNLTCCLDSQRV